MCSVDFFADHSDGVGEMVAAPVVAVSFASVVAAEYSQPAISLRSASREGRNIAVRGHAVRGHTCRKGSENGGVLMLGVAVAPADLPVAPRGWRWQWLWLGPVAR